MEIWVDDAIVQALLPGATYNDLVQRLDMDVVTVPTMVYSDDEVQWIERTPDRRTFIDKWGSTQTLTHEALPVTMQPPRIEGPDDLAAYTPPDPAASPVIERVRRVREQVGDGKALAVIGEAGLAPAEYLRAGLENICLDFALQPDFAKDLIRIGVEYHCELYRLAIEAGADIVLLGDDYASKNGPMMSPATFEDIILPGLTEVVQSIKRAGGYCIKHSDGNLWKIIDMIAATGVDMLGPLEPGADMDLARVREHFGGKVGVLGNIDVDLLSRGSTEDVVAATKDLLRRVSPGGGHIMASGNSISSSVKPENFLAMVETTKRYGTYPIDTDQLR